MSRHGLSQSDEIEELRVGLERLRIHCANLESRVALLEGHPQQRTVSAGYSASFTQVSSPVRSQASAASTRRDVVAGDTEGRIALAREIGAYLRRAYDGLPRGASGRDRLALQNKWFLVLVDFEGRRLEEPLISHSFSAIRDRCKRGSDTADSVFIGFATKWEAKLALEAGRFPVPAELRDE
eukprot:s246_g23.t1